MKCGEHEEVTGSFLGTQAAVRPATGHWLPPICFLLFHGFPRPHPTVTQPTGKQLCFHRCQGPNSENLNHDISSKPSLPSFLNPWNYTSQVHLGKPERNTLIIHNTICRAQTGPLHATRAQSTDTGLCVVRSRGRDVPMTGFHHSTRKRGSCRRETF